MKWNFASPVYFVAKFNESDFREEIKWLETAGKWAEEKNDLSLSSSLCVSPIDGLL